MKICAKIFTVLAIAAAFGCTREEKPVVIPDQLRFVPSDAVAVISGTCRVCLSELDSAHAFRNIGLEEYPKADAIIAYCFTSVISPVLVVDANLDTTVVAKAERAGVSLLETEVAPAEEGAEMIRRFVFAVSESTMAAVCRHLSMGTSILDAPGFVDAVKQTADVRHWAILRNDDASKLLPRDFLNGMFSRKDIIRLMKNMCDWTCIRWTGRRECEIISVNGDSREYFSNMMAELRPASSKLPEILPLATDFAIDIPIDTKSFRKAYLTYLDATQRLPDYYNKLLIMKKETGEDPVRWENSFNIKEIAMVGWDGKKVVLLRPSSGMNALEPGENAYRGFVSVLYGFPFELADDSFCAIMDGWMVIGSENDVRVFLDEERPEVFKWPARPVKLAVFTSDAMVSWTRDNLTIEL